MGARKLMLQWSRKFKILDFQILYFVKNPLELVNCYYYFSYYFFPEALSWFAFMQLSELKGSKVISKLQIK